jgi:hypothetical protein
MGRNRRPLLRCVAWGTVILVCVGMIGGAEVAVQKPAAAEKRIPEQLTKNQRLLKLLDYAMETKTFEGGGVARSLRDFLNLLHDKLDKEGIELPILVDFESFKDSNPDVYKEPHDLLDETKLTIPQPPKRLTLRRILEIALSKVPTNNATFIVRKDAVEITTAARAAPYFLINSPVAAVFDNRRLGDALQELSGLTGAAITTSPRVSTKLDTQVTATFANNLSLKTAVGILAEMADLKVVELPGALFITTSEQAEAMRKERKAQQEDELWRKSQNLPEVNAPGYMPADLRLKAGDAGV